MADQPSTKAPNLSSVDPEERARTLEAAYVETRAALSEFRQLVFQRSSVESAEALRISGLEERIDDANRTLSEISGRLQQVEVALRESERFQTGFLKFFPLRLAIYRAFLRSKRKG